MQIEKIVAAIRKSDIGKVMYKARPAGNFLGVFGLKPRPPDTVFLETGTLEDIGLTPVVNQTYKRFRQSISKDFAILACPESYCQLPDDTFSTRVQYQLVDLDLYTYLITIQAITDNKLLVESTGYSKLFYLDGRFINYQTIINQNMFNYSFVFSEYSPLTPYIYRKRNAEFFAEENIEDVLISFKKSAEKFDLQTNFESLQLLSNIATLPT
jgi:hypothetical protein